MKTLKLIIASLSLLSVFFYPTILSAEEGCWRRESGYNLNINGMNICVLDNNARECFALVNRCKIQ